MTGLISEPSGNCNSAYLRRQAWLKVVTDHRKDDNNWWASLIPPESEITITLSTSHGNTKPGTMNLYFATSDIVKAHKELSRRFE